MPLVARSMEASAVPLVMLFERASLPRKCDICEAGLGPIFFTKTRCQAIICSSEKFSDFASSHESDSIELAANFDGLRPGK
jgi:hypothetical protein